MSVNIYDKDTQTLTEVAGTGTVEFGASTVRTGTASATVTVGAGSEFDIHVTFDTPMTDTNYIVVLDDDFRLDEPVGNYPLYRLQIRGKGTTGFDFHGRAAAAMSGVQLQLRYTAFKLHTVEGLEELETAVGKLKPSSPVLLEKTAVSGLTTAWRDNLAASHCAYRVGNLVIMNISMTVNGTYSGESGWFNLWDMPTSLLNSGESFVPPYFSYIVKYADGTLGDIMNGQTKYLTSGQDYALNIQGQIVLIIV